jgi:hypothetical protein
VSLRARGASVVAGVLFILMLGLAAVHASYDKVSIKVGSRGLTSLAWHGQELLGEGAFRAEEVILTNSDGVSRHADLKHTTSITSPSSLLYEYAWGVVTVNFTPASNRLGIAITTRNTGSDTISRISYQVLSVHMPGKVGDYDGSTPLLGHGMGEPTIIRLSTPLLTLVAVDEDLSKPLLTGFPWALDKPGNSVFPLRVDTGRNPMYPDSLPLIARTVPPDESDEIRLSLRFGAGNLHREQLAHDVLTRYAQAHPAQLQWNDRRPIGMIMLSTSATGWPTNPRGWFYDRNVNVVTPEGLEDFRQRLHVFARNSISIMRDMNAQGMITWDIEGQEFQHPLSYVGDPRLTAQLAPEMADAADQYFAEFRQAGFRVGICIRPDRAFVKSSGNLTHETATEPEEELAQKIAFARDRWGATLFYVDSNGLPAWPMDAGVFERVARRFPDVLLIPEHKTLQYYAYTAPYQELRGGHTSTPSLANTVFPRAFSCINTADGQPGKHVQELAQARRKGDIFLYRTWFQDPENKVLLDLNRSPTH